MWEDVGCLTGLVNRCDWISFVVIVGCGYPPERGSCHTARTYQCTKMKRKIIVLETVTHLSPRSPMVRKTPIWRPGAEYLLLEWSMPRT